jgi:hypothetical protein
VGLVLDARDAPLYLPRRIDDRRAILAGWREVLLREPVRVHAPEAPARRQLGARERLRRLASRGARGGRTGGEDTRPAEADDSTEEAP